MWRHSLCLHVLVRPPSTSVEAARLSLKLWSQSDWGNGCGIQLQFSFLTWAPGGAVFSETTRAAGKFFWQFRGCAGVIYLNDGEVRNRLLFRGSINMLKGQEYYCPEAELTRNFWFIPSLGLFVICEQVGICFFFKWFVFKCTDLVAHMSVWGCWSPGTGVPHSCKQPCGCSELNPRFSERAASALYRWAISGPRRGYNSKCLNFHHSEKQHGSSECHPSARWSHGL